MQYNLELDRLVYDKAREMVTTSQLFNFLVFVTTSCKG
jgi:hypothetical protein